MNINRECAVLIKYAYAESDPDQKKPVLQTGLSYQILGYLRARPAGLISRQELFGFVAFNPEYNYIFIIFRGTASAHDWLSNAGTHQNHNGIHNGFYKLYAQMNFKILQIVDDFKKNTPQARVVVAGHSLGGALATLCGLSLAKYNPRVITYASPRVGDVAFALSVDRQISVTRWINTEDIVPTIPEPVLGDRLYQHVGEPLCFTENLGSITRNHGIDLYIAHC